MSVSIRGNSRRSTDERQMLKRTIATPGMYRVSREAIRIVRVPALVRPMATTAPHAAKKPKKTGPEVRLSHRCVICPEAQRGSCMFGQEVYDHSFGTTGHGY